MHGHESIKPPKGDPPKNSSESFDVSLLPSRASNSGNARHGKEKFNFYPKNTIETSRMKTENLQDIRPFFEKFLENLLRENNEKSETELIQILEKNGVGFIPSKESANQEDCEKFFRSIRTGELHPVSAHSFSDEKGWLSTNIYYQNKEGIGRGEVSIIDPKFMDDYEKYIEMKT